LTRWRYATATDTGLIRDTNQDAVFVDDSLALVADGMGGHAAGEIASVLTSEVVRDHFAENSTVEGLYRAIESANRAIIADARANPERLGMGTTLIAVGLTHDSSGLISPTLFNVGDSRAYQLRDGALRQLSEDHSVAEEWVRMGRLTPDEALTHPRRHQLTRALGVEEKLEIDVSSIDAVSGDRILLCSDGLSNELSVDVLAELASSPTSLEEAVTGLVAAAKEAGGRDNISVVLLEFDEVNVATEPIRKTVGANPLPIALSSRAGSSQSKRRRIVTWRLVVGVTLLALIVAGAVFIVHWYAYSSYYLADDAGTIAVYQGQPNGVLWYKPVKVFDTTFLAAQLRTVDLASLRVTISEPSLSAALNYASYLHSAWKLSNTSVTSPVVTTTTTVNGSTTTTVAKAKG
jgi:serine/threonine protein phosphatase PrpC